MFHTDLFPEIQKIENFYRMGIVTFQVRRIHEEFVGKKEQAQKVAKKYYI